MKVPGVFFCLYDIFIQNGDMIQDCRYYERNHEHHHSNYGDGFAGELSFSLKNTNIAITSNIILTKKKMFIIKHIKI